ncbi:MAG TPA: hypothetical protein PKD98_07595, partial [Anaerolineae bacterium]|nr:hypothetical protein [Anaerolineae bacterium]
PWFASRASSALHFYYSVSSRSGLSHSDGYATDPVMANYEFYGFQGRVVKPYCFADLQKVVQQVLMTDDDSEPVDR